MREGRKREFASFARFAAATVRCRIRAIPATFRAAQLDWSRIAEPRHAHWLALHRRLLAHPRANGSCRWFPAIERRPQPAAADADGFIAVEWLLRDGGTLQLVANLGPTRRIVRCTPPAAC